MNRFLAPGRCPDCAAPVSREVRCPSCGLVLVGQVADDLRSTLLRADQILDVLRHVSVQQPVPAPAAPAAAAPPEAPGAPTAAAPAPRRGLPAVSVPVVLLGLGTLCVLVAAVVFVAVTWTDLSLAWRTSILLLVTAVATGAAAWVVRARLRGAAEALTLVASGLLLIDLLAGNATGLPLLSAVQGRPFQWLVAVTMAGVALAWVIGARRVLSQALTGQQVVLVVAVVEMVRLAVLGWPYDDAWVAAAVTVAAAAAALALWRVRITPAGVGCGLVAVLAWTYLAGAGLLRAVSADGPGDLFLGLDGLPLLTAAALAAVVAVTSWVPSPVRVGAGVLAVAGVAVVALLPVRVLPGTVAVLLVAAAALVLVVGGRYAASPWSSSLRVVGAATMVMPGYVLVVGASEALARVFVSVEQWWSRQLGDPLPPMATASESAWDVGFFATWAFLPLGGLLAAAGVLALSFDARVRSVLVSGGAGVAVGGLTALLSSSSPLVLTEAVLLALALLCVIGYRRVRSWVVLGAAMVPVLLGVVAAFSSVTASALFLAAYGVLLVVAAALSRAATRSVLVGAGVASAAVSVEALADLGGLSVTEAGLPLVAFALAVLVAAQLVAGRDDGGAWRRGLEAVTVPLLGVALLQCLVSDTVSTIAFAAGGVVTGVVAAAVRDRRSVACVSTVLLAAAAASAVQLGGAGSEWGAVAASAVAGLGALVAQLLAREADAVASERPPRYEPRVALELTAVLTGAVSVSAQTADSLATTVGLTLLGISAILVSFVSADRRRLAWVGSLLLVAASWVRLTALQVDVIEAYTLPGALALLVAALAWFRRTPTATSWQALAPPLGLGLVPSLVVALTEPTSPRAMVVGLVGLALVLLGVRMRWGAPLLFGGVSVALLALVNIAPYAAGLPRWVLFGTAGVALLLLGVTWEQRRADLVTMQRYAARLR